MNEPRSIDGRWHLFGNRRAAHYGILEYDPEKGLSLTVKIPKSRSFENVLQTRPIPVPEIVHGFDKHDHPITLFGCGITGQNLSGGLAIFEISPIYALLGHHFSTGWNEITFDGAVVKYSLLNEWMSRSAIQHSKTSEGTPAVTHIVPPDIVVSIDPQITLRITSELSGHTALSEYRLSHDHCVHLDFLRHPCSVRSIYSDYILSFARLLTLFTDTRIYATRVHFEVKDGGNTKRIEFLVSNSGVRDVRRSGRVQMRAQYHEIQNSFPGIVQNWFAREETYKSVLNLYFATIFVETLYASHQFLFLAQALEVYHNSNPSFTNVVQERAQFRERVRRIIKKASASQGLWLKEKLRHANQKTLAQRLRDILDAHRPEVRRFIKKPRAFAASIRHTRNYYTHFDPHLKRKGKVAEDTDLFLLILRMRALVEICILKDLGITGSPIDRVIERVRHIKITSP